MVPLPRHGCERRSRKGLTPGDTRTKQGAACAVSHPPFVFYSDPTSSETKNPPNWVFSYLGEGHKFLSRCFGASWACSPGKGRLHFHLRRVTLLAPHRKVTAWQSRGQELGLQANHHYFFQQKGGNFSGRALILNGSCLMLLCAGSSHLEMAGTNTGRVGMDVQEDEMRPRGIWIHHKVPDMLHPHWCPQHSGSCCGLAQPPHTCWKNRWPKVPLRHKAQPVSHGKLVSLHTPLFNKSHVLPTSAAQRGVSAGQSFAYHPSPLVQKADQKPHECSRDLECHSPNKTSSIS